MKTLIALFTLFLLTVSLSSFAQDTIVTQTRTWKSVPITVDTTNRTYTVTGTVPTDTTDYYYTYSGYRCFTQKRTAVGVDGVVYTTTGGSEIYCYPVQ